MERVGDGDDEVESDASMKLSENGRLKSFVGRIEAEKVSSFEKRKCGNSKCMVISWQDGWYTDLEVDGILTVLCWDLVLVEGR